MFSIIASVGKNNEIGKKGELVFHLKEDMKFFRKTTKNHTVVMGLNTWLSLPGKLKNRKSIVICEKDVPKADQTVKDLPSFIKNNQNTTEEIFVIGGGVIYKEFLPHARTIYLPEIDASDEEADTFFPIFDKAKYKTTLIKKGSEDGLNYSIVKYNKI